MIFFAFFGEGDEKGLSALRTPAYGKTLSVLSREEEEADRLRPPRRLNTDW